MDKEMRTAEAMYEGELKGLKTMIDTYYKVLDAMASQISTMNKL